MFLNGKLRIEKLNPMLQYQWAKNYLRFNNFCSSMSPDL